MTAVNVATGAEVRCVGVVHVYRVAGTDVAALRGVDLRVAPGERVALLGPSGSGKSTLLSIVAGLRRPSAGSVQVDGTDIARLTEKELYAYRGGAVGLMLQGTLSNLLAYASPMENVRYAAAGDAAAAEAGLGRQVLAVVGLATETRPVARLDRAAQQAVALAVAMASSPRMLLVDEPTSQLDETSRDQLLDVLVQTSEAAGTTVLIVTHDEEVANRMSRMVRMREGRVGSEGQRDEQRAIIGADGSLQLPEPLLADWPAGSAVEVVAAGPDRIEIIRRGPGERA